VPSAEFSYFVSVRRLSETPADPTPLSDDEWSRVRQLAHAVDLELEAQDVRLTMGGEPTFVAIDDPASPQWNVEALGAAKKSLGLALIDALSKRVAPGALLHFR